MHYVISDNDVDFDVLKIPSKNIAHTQFFLEEEGVENFFLPGYITPHGYRLVKALKRDQYRLIATGYTPETVYLVALRFRDDIVYGRTTCTQIKVWRTVSSLHDSAVRDLPRTFFANLLKNYSIVVTDEEQTSDGKRFWGTMIVWAFQSGFHVYISDGTQIDRPLTEIRNMDEFYQQWGSFCWGSDRDVHTHRLVVISNDMLAQ